GLEPPTGLAQPARCKTSDADLPAKALSSPWRWAHQDRIFDCSIKSTFPVECARASLSAPTRSACARFHCCRLGSGAQEFSPLASLMTVAILRSRPCSEAKSNLINSVDRRRFLIQTARILDCLRGASLAPQIQEIL